MLSHIIAHLTNLSFSEGCFSSGFKAAQITPLLKKSGLDTNLPVNYRLISNLNNISKLLERLFLTRIQNHVTSCLNFNPNQSAYRQHHSTETSLLATADNILNFNDQFNSALLVSPDMSSAFDTIDYNILLDRLHTSFGVSHMALNWISSCLHDRS